MYPSYWFGLGELTGNLAWRRRKSPWIARLCVAVSLAAFCVVIVISIPSRLAAPARGDCINNLRQLEGAKHQSALEQHRLTNDTPTWEELKPYLKTGLTCPDGGSYTIGRIERLPTCSVPWHDSFWRQAHQKLE